MAENIEFIAASNLPVTEAEEVDVLCVDSTTGEMRRKSGAKLGGYAKIVRITEDELASDSGVTSVNFDDFAEHLYNGGAVVIGIYISDVATYGYVTVTSYVFIDGGVYCMGYSPLYNSGDDIAIMFTNGTWTPPTE